MISYISPLPRALPASGKKRLCLLGSTGSIGRSALDVISRSESRFSVTALAGAANTELLAAQAAQFRPGWLGVLTEQAARDLRRRLPPGYAPEIVTGQEGYEQLASLPTADVVLSAQVGAAGLRATVAAARQGKTVALANKESLVLAGELLRRICAQSGAVILPVDSEHNALFQCLAGNRPEDVSRLILTASGGPFFGRSAAEMEQITPAQALAHPTWNMGRKISIDSATMMNKGLEIIEACHLFGLPLEQVDVLIHQESIVHSLVEYSDGALIAHLGVPDMRHAIAHALAWPERLHGGTSRLDLARTGRLSFSDPDPAAFPCLALARRAQARGAGCPVVLNAANELAVEAFLKNRTGFAGIARLVEAALDGYEAILDARAQGVAVPDAGTSPMGPDQRPANFSRTFDPASLDSILELDAITRDRVRALLREPGHAISGAAPRCSGTA